MSHDYGEEDNFDGFSEHEESQVYISDDLLEDHSLLYDEEASEALSDSDDESKDHTGFFDDEASEADSESGPGIAFETNNAIFPDTLHKFKKLPAELREMIWKAFCPDLSTEPRVYELVFGGKYLRFAAQIEDQIYPLRTVLTVHRESRALAHKFAPDLIQLPHGFGVAPWHAERDILFVDWTFDHRYCPGLDELAILGQAAPGLQNLAFTAGVTFYDGGSDLERLYSLKNVFVSRDADDIPTRGLTWCLSNNNHSYHVVHQEDMGSGITEDVDVVFFWPDPNKYGESGERTFSSHEFASLQFDQEGMTVDAEGERISEEVTDDAVVSQWGWEIARLREFLDPLHEMNEPSPDHSRSGSSEPDNEETQEEEETTVRTEPSDPPRPQRISVWPFTRFMFSSGVDRLEAMKAWQKPWDEWESDRELEEYEEDSSDIDSDDSLHDFIALDDTIDPETDDEEDASQSEDGDGSPSHTAQNQHIVLDSGDEDESSTETGEPPRARPRNRVVLDLVGSSEGEEEDEDAAPQRGGNSNRRARARPIPVDSDDEDDDEDLPQPSRTGTRRAAVLLSESEDDNEIAGEHEKTDLTVEDEANFSSEQEEDVSDEEPAPPPRMSLAKRLRLEAAQARAALQADESDNDDEDGNGRASDDSEEDTSGGEEMTMGMAEPGEEDDEEGW